MVKYAHGHSALDECPSIHREPILSAQLKRTLTFVLVPLVAIALAGGAYAATQTGSSTSRQAFLSDVAKRLGVAPAKLTSALQAAYADRLAAEVTAGRLTQAQANAIEQRIKRTGTAPMLGGAGVGAGRAAWGAAGSVHGAWRSRGSGAVFGGHFTPRPGFGFGFGFGLLGGGGERAAAGYLGLSASTLRADLRAGRSLAQIAKAQGKTAAGLQSAITAAITTRLDKAVAAQRITAAQEKALLAKLPSLLSAEIQRTAAHP